MPLKPNRIPQFHIVEPVRCCKCGNQFFPLKTISPIFCLACVPVVIDELRG